MIALLRHAVLLAVVALLTAAPGAGAAISAPPSQWFGLPGLTAAAGAPWVRALAHATPPNVVYAGLESGGVYSSSSGGATWLPFNDGFPSPATTSVRALLTTGAGTTVYAGTGTGVWRSTGGAWQPLGQATLNGSVRSLLSLPGDVLLAGVDGGGVWKSTDGGASWKAPAAANGMPASETPAGFVAQPAFVLAATGHGIFRSANGGDSWTLVSDGIPASVSPIQPSVDASHPDLMYVSTAANGVYRSIDGGTTWSAINAGLGAVHARALQVLTAAEGAHLYAATEDGLWEALESHAADPPAPVWHAVTQEGLFPPTDAAEMWSLTAPVIPGNGAPGLIAGTRTNGGYYLGFESPDSICSASNPTATAICPRVSDSTPAEGQTLTALNGTWTGTEGISYAYRWQECTSSSPASCSDVADAEETSFVVPPKLSPVSYRVKVTATNAAPTFTSTVRTSIITSATTSPGGFPGASQAQAPAIAVTPAHAGAPVVGDALFAAAGSLTATDPAYGWFNPPATATPTFQWLRCESADTDCNEIPGATARSYTTTVADGRHQLRVRATGTNPSGSRQLTSSSTAAVVSAPAAIGAAIPDPDGGPAKSQVPAIVGDAWIGETLAGTVGGWQDPSTQFSRRWLRCDAAGNACADIQQTGSTYIVRPEDLGLTLRLRVTADVGGDLSDGGADDLPAAVTLDTAPTAVIALKPSAGGGGGGDRTRPVVSRLRVTNKRFAVAKGRTAIVAKRLAKGTKFTFNLSEVATVAVAIERLAPGRKVGRACRKPTRKNGKRKRCTRAVREGKPLTRRNLKAGKASIRFTGRIGRHKLPPGPYRATVVATDAARNPSKPATVSITIVRAAPRR